MFLSFKITRVKGKPGKVQILNLILKIRNHNITHRSKVFRFYLCSTRFSYVFIIKNISVKGKPGKVQILNLTADEK